jgi:hypothetical protein
VCRNLSIVHYKTSHTQERVSYITHRMRPRMSPAWVSSSGAGHIKLDLDSNLLRTSHARNPLRRSPMRTSRGVRQLQLVDGHIGPEECFHDAVAVGFGEREVPT